MSLATTATELQLRRACAELVGELRDGRAVRSEEFLDRFPEIASVDEAAVELIYTEFVTREELGEQPLPEEYTGRFPRWRTALAEQLRIHALFAERPAEQPAAGRHIGPYEILEEVARGSMGVVYRARHGVLNRVVALKMILAGAHAGKRQLARFRVEAEAIARLQHPNIVQVYEVGEHEGRPFLALEFVAGGSLAEQVARQPMTPAAAAALIEQLARAVEHAHAQGIVHRDLKPGNVLFDRDGSPRIADFGLAKVLDQPEGQSESGVIFGTPSYMAPEQAAGRRAEVGPAADIYALGSILYELLTGTPPFRGETVLHTLQQVMTEEPIAADRMQPNVPRDLATVCMKCLNKDPGKRYANTAELAEDLRRVRAGEPIRARRTGLAERGWKWARRRPLVAALLTTLAMLSAALLLGTLSYNAQSRAIAREADQRRAEARRQSAEAERRRLQAETAADEARRQIYALQLARAEEALSSNPAHALVLLEDAERCPSELRDFAWGLLRHLCKQHRMLRTAHSHGVPALAFSPDGGTLALAGGDDRTVTLWDAKTWQPYVTLRGHQGTVRCLAFAPDGETLATGGDDRTILLWRVASGVARHVLCGHSGSVRALSFSPDGKLLASAGQDRTVMIWDVAEGKRRSILRGHDGSVTTLSFAPDGVRLATGSEDGTVRLWDPLTEGEDRERGRATLAEHEQVTCAVFSPDGKWLAVAGDRRTSVALFDAQALQPQRTCRGHLDRVQALAFSPDGKLLASGSEDRTVRLWEVETALPCLVFQGQTAATRALAFSPDGQALAAGGDDSQVQLFHVERRGLAPAAQDLEESRRRQIVSLAYALDGETVVTGGNDGVLRLWDAGTRTERASWGGHTGTIWTLAFAPDGRTLATGGEDATIKLWDLPTRRLLATLTGYQKRVRSLAFSPADGTLATSDEDGGVRLWNVADRTERRRLGSEVGPTYAVGFSPDGKSLAAGTATGKVVIWDITDGTKRIAGSRHGQAVLFALFSPDGHTLATGGLDNRVKLWDVGELKPRADLPWTAGYVFSASYTPDGRTLAAGGGSRVGSHYPAEVALYDVTIGQRRATLARQAGPAAFSPHGDVLATVEQHTGVVFWRADEGG